MQMNFSRLMYFTLFTFITVEGITQKTNLKYFIERRKMNHNKALWKFNFITNMTYTAVLYLCKNYLSNIF